MSIPISREPEEETTAIRLGSEPELRIAFPASETPPSDADSATPALKAPSRGELGMAGPYRLALELAQGGMGVVYLAIQELRRFENTVAVKRIHGHLAQDRKFIDMFSDEARIAASINHPYVCRVFDFGKASGSYYIAMEYLRGEPLSKLFRRLTPERVASPRHATIAARIIANLAEGLHAAHSLKDNNGVSLEVIHRDISPQNLFVLCDGTVRVTDFGIAKARARKHKTQDGSVKGKIMYMAPEQLQGHAVDCRIDVWSLGVVAWKFFTGRSLFHARGEGEAVLAILKRQILPPSRLNPALPPELDAIVLKALARNPDERYPTARAFARELELFIRGSATNLDVAEWIEETIPGLSAKHQELVQRGHEAVREYLPQRVVPATVSDRGELVATSRWRRSLRSPLVLSAVIGSFVVADFAYFELHRAHAATHPTLALTTTRSTHAAIVGVPKRFRSASALFAPFIATPHSAAASASAYRASADAHMSSLRAPAVAAALETGSVQLETQGGRAEVLIGNSVLGTTPMTLDLPPGNHTLELKPLTGGELRTIDLSIVAGTDSFVSVTLATTPAPVSSDGS